MNINDFLNDTNIDKSKLMDMLKDDFLPYEAMTKEIEKRLEHPLLALKCMLCDKIYDEMGKIAKMNMPNTEYDPSKIDIFENPSLIMDFKDHLELLHMMNRALKEMDDND